jgi:hypothetical protein
MTLPAPPLSRWRQAEAGVEMSKSSLSVGDAREMLAGMNPVLDKPDYVFCSAADDTLAAAALPLGLAMFREDEGMSLILERGAAQAHGFDVSLPMRRIVLAVNSALDGVGLTAAVASTLAAQKIPCNVVAAFRHDHIFVPAAMAEEALAILNALQTDAARLD